MVYHCFCKSTCLQILRDRQAWVQSCLRWWRNSRVQCWQTAQREQILECPVEIKTSWATLPTLLQKGPFAKGEPKLVGIQKKKGKYEAPSFIFQWSPSPMRGIGIKRWPGREVSPRDTVLSNQSRTAGVTLLTSKVCMRLGLMASFIRTVNAPLTPYKTKAPTVDSHQQKNPTFWSQNSTFLGLPFLAILD